MNLHFFSRLFLLTSIFILIFQILSAQNSDFEKSKELVIILDKKFYLHKVEPQQTIYTISKLYDVSIEEILLHNNKETVDLDIDEVLKIPFIPKQIEVNTSNSFKIHIVNPQETVYGLSKRYNVSIDELIKINPHIKLGLKFDDTLKIPQSKKNISEINDKKKTPKDYYDFKYYYHFVEKGETQFSLARKFNMRIKKLQRYNKWLKYETIKVGNKIRVPKKFAKDQIYELDLKKIEDIEIDKPTKDSLLTDTILHIDTTLFFNKDLKSRYAIGLILPISSSKRILRFYQGVLLAFEEFRNHSKIGIDLNVYNFDKENQNINEILNKQSLKELDLIISPNSKTVSEKVIAFADWHQIPVAPLSPLLPDVYKNPGIIQINTTYSTLALIMAKHIVENHKDDNIVYLNNNKFNIYDYDSTKSVVTNIKALADTIILGFITETFDFERDYLIQFNRVLVNDKRNIVICPALKETNVSRILSTLNGAKTYKEKEDIRFIEKDITVYGMQVWQYYDVIDPDLFYRLNVNYFSPFYVDYRSENVKNFIRKFRSTYYSEPHGLSFRGYDMAWFLLSGLNLYGEYLNLYLNNINTKLLNADFKFDKYEYGGYENTRVFKVTYTPNFKVEHKIITPQFWFNSD